MLESFHLGGWPMYLTLTAGAALVAAAFRFARAPDGHRQHVALALAALTALVACLGTVLGVMKSMSAAGVADDPRYVTVGIGESLHNLALGLVLLVVAAVAMVVGAYRRGAQAPSGSARGAELADPHQR
jgi:hypothetical protein